MGWVATAVAGLIIIAVATLIAKHTEYKLIALILFILGMLATLIGVVGGLQGLGVWWQQLSS